MDGRPAQTRLDLRVLINVVAVVVVDERELMNGIVKGESGDDEDQTEDYQIANEACGLARSGPDKDFRASDSRLRNPCAPSASARIICERWSAVQ